MNRFEEPAPGTDLACSPLSFFRQSFLICCIFCPPCSPLSFFRQSFLICCIFCPPPPPLLSPKFLPSEFSDLLYLLAPFLSSVLLLSYVDNQENFEPGNMNCRHKSHTAQIHNTRSLQITQNNFQFFTSLTRSCALTVTEGDVRKQGAAIDLPCLHILESFRQYLLAPRLEL